MNFLWDDACACWVGESEDGGRKTERENRMGSASKVIIAVAVVASIAVTVGKFHIALILLLVDPLHNVLMAKP